MIGQTFSHYRITAAIGAGGMGEVYRATDTNLGRDVAIKVLPPEVAQDPERLGRFQREAHLLASLNHPNIAAIYGLEEADGKPFLALELVEGEELKERLARGALPVDEALEIAEQVAEALEEAHNKGIVHRDLKPANVKLTPEGKVKVLDFGLAKAWSGENPDGSSPSAALSQSPTLAHTGTVAGVILGTAAYMSPEQARGKPVDKRADLWSFGVLLWEMLTGRTLFPGDTVTDVIAAVVRAEPDLDALPAATPQPVRRLLARCLRKDPRTRLPDIGAARLELQDVRAGRDAPGDAAGGDPGTAAEMERRGRRKERWAWSALALVLGGVAAALALAHPQEAPPPRPPAGRFVIDAPDGWRFHSWGWPVPSPDGSQIVFRAVPEGATNENESTMLWTRPLEAETARPLTGTERAEHPFWSPDGQFVGFFAEGELRKLSLANGTVQRICAVPGPALGGADWNPDGAIVFMAGAQRPDNLYTVAAAGGEPQQITSVAAPESQAFLAFPQFLPGGQDLTFLAGGQADTPPSVDLAPLSAPDERRRLLDGATRLQRAGRYAFFVQGTTLLAQPFDTDEGALTGEPVTTASSVGVWGQNPGVGWFGASPGGTLAYLSGQTVSGDVQLTWLDRKGGPIGTLGAPGAYGQIVLSPDERNVALEIPSDESGWDLWVMDVARGVASRVTAGPGDERNPVWAPDGRSLTFSALEEGSTEADLRRKGLRASDPETVLVDTEDQDYPEMWSRDGRTLLFIRQAPEDYTQQSIWTLSIEEGSEPEPLENSGFTVDEPQVSPDGRWLAYNSRESGRSEVYVEPYHRDGERVRVSIDGGGQPKWRGDGKEMFFTSLDGHLMSVAFRDRNDRAEVDLPTELFEIGGIEGPDYDDYAPSADGQRFLVKVAVDQGQRTRMHVVTNWPSLLE
ncbi:MAG: protein kinase [Acidobacteria bacterium]|jgi:Tol biopolymer transport system component|nr:protein kinase [Acidobacteriota bacterium]